MRIVLTLLLLFGLAYFYTDRQLYFYGKSDLKVYHPLPINVKPDYWGYDRGNIGFVFVDDFDFTIVGRGNNKYRSFEVFANEISRYGFDKKKIIVVVVDSLGHDHFLTLQSGDKPEIEVIVDTKSDHNEITWVEIKGKDKYVSQLEWIRSFIRIGLFILIIVVGYRIVRVLVQRGSTPTTSM